MGLTELVEISRRYGQDADFVLAGGGNTSFKDSDLLYVKASGTTLADLSVDCLVRMERAKLTAIWAKRYADDPKERERQALADLMAARAAGETKRPSVETLLHELLRPHYVVHLHPALVNGLTCARNGEEVARELFGRRMLWIPVVNPGYVLAKHIREAIDARLASGEEYPNVLFLQNHGVFVASDDIEEIDHIYGEMMRLLSDRLLRSPDLGTSPGMSDEASDDASALREAGAALARVIERRGLASGLAWEAIDNPEVRRLVSSELSFRAIRSLGYTPDHLVYCKAAPLWLSFGADAARFEALAEEAVGAFARDYRTAPRIAAVEGTGVVVVGEAGSVLENARALFLDLVKIVTYAESFGGPQPMPRDKIEFILSWEVENYRAKVGRSET